jgi:hypothetical protein
VSTTVAGQRIPEGEGDGDGEGEGEGLWGRGGGRGTRIRIRIGRRRRRREMKRMGRRRRRRGRMNRRRRNRRMWSSDGGGDGGCAKEGKEGERWKRGGSQNHRRAAAREDIGRPQLPGRYRDLELKPAVTRRVYGFNFRVWSLVVNIVANEAQGIIK